MLSEKEAELTLSFIIFSLGQRDRMFQVSLDVDATVAGNVAAFDTSRLVIVDLGTVVACAADVQVGLAMRPCTV